MNTTESDNEVIAKFMGLMVFKTYAEMQESPIEKLTDWVLPEQILYDENWNWLMPVVEKIESFGHYVSIGTGDIEIGNDDVPVSISFEEGDTKMSMLYKAVVEFIHWHNSLPSTTKEDKE